MHNRMKKSLLTPGARFVTWTLPAELANGILDNLTRELRGLSNMKPPKDPNQRAEFEQALAMGYEATLDLACLVFVSHASICKGDCPEQVETMRAAGTLRENRRVFLGIDIPDGAQTVKLPDTATAAPPAEPPPAPPPVAPAPEPEEGNNDSDADCA